MHLTQQTDVALRILLYLAMHREQVVSSNEISRRFHLSQEHTAKVAKLLVKEGLVESRRGRFGGLLLASGAAEQRVGQLVQRLEPLVPLPCMEGQGSCPITGGCLLQDALHEATRAFIETLDRYTLEDLAQDRPRLLRLLARPRQLTG
jgi:Rrf2 family nitric oxide-sensitive transcriptional repressor